jgi:uncharacterized repeat protein (TIGR01451 family)
LGGSTTLTFTISNPSALVALTGIGFTDTLPAGLAVATPNGLNIISSCGATPSATAGGTTISLAGGSLPAAGSCSFRVNVMAVAVGTQNNVTSAITSSVGTGGTASSSLTVGSPTNVPVLSPGALGAFALLLGALGLIYARRHAT